MAKQLAFYIDTSVCIGCKACQVACKDKNDLEVGRLWRRVYEVSGGQWIQRGKTWENSVYAYMISIGCMHCQNPLCVEACPTGAMTKRADGIVLIDADKCIGCRYCEWACPYDAPQFNEATGKMTKCDMCADYVDQGQPTACVASCPMRAVELGELSALQAKYGPNNTVYPLPDPAITQPSIIIKPHIAAVSAQVHQAPIVNPEEV